MWSWSSTCLFLSVVLWMVSTAMGSPQSKRPSLFLSCKTSETSLSQIGVRDLCDVLQKKLQSHFPNHAVKQVEQMPVLANEGTLGELVVQALRSDHLRGFLQWRKLETGQTHEGPSVQVDGMDGAPVQRLYEGFADGMIKVSTPPWEK